MVSVGAVKFGGGELPRPAPSSEEVWNCGISGSPGMSWKSKASCGCRGDTGVGGSEDRELDCMETCWADSARARANMRAAFLGGGGGGAEVAAEELRERGVRSFEESGATTPWCSWLQAAGACCVLSSPFSSRLSTLSEAASLVCSSIWKASLSDGSAALSSTLPIRGGESLGPDGGDNGCGGTACPAVFLSGISVEKISEVANGVKLVAFPHLIGDTACVGLSV